VTTQYAELRILLVISPERRSEIICQLAPLKARLVFMAPSGETADPIREDDTFQVAIPPANLLGKSAGRP